MIIIAVLTGIIALCSLLLLRHKLHPIELLTYWAFITPIEQLSYILLTENLHYVEINQDISVYLALRITDIITIPIIILWFLATIHSNALSVTLKTIFFVIFDFVFTGMDYYLWKIQVYTFINWTLFNSMLLYAAMLTIAAAFMFLFRFFLKKELP